MDNNNNFFKIITLGENVKSNIKIIGEFKDHFKILLSNNIIQQSKYNDVMDKIKFLNDESINQLKLLQILEKNHILTESKILLSKTDEYERQEKQESINCETDIITEADLINSKIYNIELNLNVITDELIKIIYDYGFTSISSVIHILDKNSFAKYKINLVSKLNAINEFYQVIRVEKKNKLYEEGINLKIKNILPKTSQKILIGENNDKNELETFDDDKISINMIYELNKAIVEIDIDDYTYIFDGFFKEDMLNEIYQTELFGLKYKNVQKKIFEMYDKSDSKFKIFFKEYMCQMSVKDFIVYSDSMLVDRIKIAYSTYIKIEKMSVIELLNDFVSSPNHYYKREIVSLLLLNDVASETNTIDLDKSNEQDGQDVSNKPDTEDEIKIVNLNDNNSKNDNSDKTDNSDSKIIVKKKTSICDKNPMPLVKMNKATATRYSINSIMKNLDAGNGIKNLNTFIANSKKILNANVLMDFLRNTLLSSEEYDNFLNSMHWSIRRKIFAKKTIGIKNKKDEEEISWETKLSLMEISDKAKDKVNEKIREVRSSKDNSKAETFIESFFRIPFGKYINEDIFVKSLNSDTKMKKYVDAINKFIPEKDNKIHVSDTLEMLKNKTLSYRLLYDIENYYMDLVKEKKNIIEEKNIYLNKVDKILEDAIYGHIESKREIKRLVAQWMGGKMEGSVLGFYGPPGVGKTCFAKKGIAKCLFDSNGNPRPFCIFQLGGATDGSVLEGHSYTYVGAKPGRLVEFLQETKCMNPIIYFDELDKVSETDKGKEIIDILIHLTDKSQNKEIFDKYFSGIELDFSKSIIIFSYNDALKVNRILRDRITEIKINPLKKTEKIIITKKYTLKEITDELNYNCVMDDNLIEYIIDTYTMEPGIRKLNEKLYQIFREINLRSLENPNVEYSLDANLIDEILTRHYKVKHYKIHTKPQVGLVNGLYASTIGLGGITLIQIKKILTTTNSMPLELTGQQGDVMKESMHCAKTLALSLLSPEEKQNVMDELKSHQFGLHIHCPDGATPKDGPSAGITITTGIYSVLTNKPIRNDIAMTGEVDLLGNVKAIGGLDAKINGAIKAGVRFVIFPKENEQDWEKIVKEKALDGEIEIFMAERIEEVIERTIIQ